jgi:hypothetical protein
MTHTFGNTTTDFTPGQRVAVHGSTDRRFTGTVTATDPDMVTVAADDGATILCTPPTLKTIRL